MFYVYKAFHLKPSEFNLNENSFFYHCILVPVFLFDRVNFKM